MDTENSKLEVVEQSNGLRDGLSTMAERIKVMEKVSDSPVVEELILARRAVEDARYRLGYAGAYARGLGPLAHKFPDQGKEVNKELKS